MYLRASAIFFAASLALLLPACGLDSALGDQPTVSGRIEEWDLGSGFTIQGLVLKPSGGLEYATVATAPVDEAGNFSMALPGYSVMSSLLRDRHRGFDELAANCMRSVHAEPESVSVATLEFKIVRGGTDLNVRQTSDLNMLPYTGEIRGELIYASREYEEVGSMSCRRISPDGSVDQEMSTLHFKAGWNQSVLTIRITKSGEIHTDYVTGALPEGVKWRLIR